MSHRRSALVASLLLGCVMCAASRDSTHIQSQVAPTHTVTILADVDGAIAFINGEQSGRTPLTANLPEGRHTLLLVPPDHEEWLSESIRESFEVNATSPDTLFLAFGHTLSITSDPFGAGVFIGDSIIGTTPMVLLRDVSIPGTIVHLQKPGYLPATLHLGFGRVKRFAVTLDRLGPDPDLPDVFPDHSHYSTSPPLRLYLTGAAAVISGALAAHFKLKADGYYASYRFTRDPSALDRTNRFDTAAALSIAATQISIGLFTYFILSD